VWWLDKAGSTTYPRISSRTHVDLAVQQIKGKWISIFHAKSIKKSIYILYKGCSTLHKETRKIDFTIFWFLLEFLQILQTAGKTQKDWRIFLHPGPYKQLDLNNYALGSNTQVRREKSFTEQPPVAEGSSPPVMWARGGQTNDLDAWLGSPSLDWRAWCGRRRRRRAAAAKPREFDFRRGQGQCWSMCGTGSSHVV
jgi:hypothetical protein